MLWRCRVCRWEHNPECANVDCTYDHVNGVFYAIAKTSMVAGDRLCVNKGSRPNRKSFVSFGLVLPQHSPNEARVLIGDEVFVVAIDHTHPGTQALFQRLRAQTQIHTPETTVVVPQEHTDSGE